MRPLRMSVLAEFVVPAAEFVLAETLTTSPDMRVEIERVAGDTQHVTPYFWAAGGDFERFEAALHADEMTRDVLTLEESQDDERFYRVTWEVGIPNLITAISKAKATVLEAATTDDDRWNVKVLFPRDEALSEFRDYCAEHDFTYEVDRLYRPENPEELGTYGVTDDQQEALEAAFHQGYFEVPRASTMTEVAEEIGISRNALSARLRRGQRNLLANTLVHEE